MMRPSAMADSLEGDGCDGEAGGSVSGAMLGGSEMRALAAGRSYIGVSSGCVGSAPRRVCTMRLTRTPSFAIHFSEPSL